MTQRAPADYKMEHIPCSIISNGMGGSHGCHHCSCCRRRPSAPRRSSPPVKLLPTAHLAPTISSISSSANDAVEEDDEPTSPAGEIHHARAVVAPIRAIHHDGDDEYIQDPLRPQADVHHSGHTRQIFLARHQQLQLHPAPINGSKAKEHKTFSSKASSNRRIFQKPLSSFPRLRPSSARPGLDDPGRSSCHTADPRSTTQPAQPTCCRTSITPPPVVATPTSICEHAHEPARCHRLARANYRRRCPCARHRLCPLPAARIHRLHPCRPRRPSTATIAWPESAAKHRPPTM
ncbi:hypothetical protein ACLOJK_025748 [Asimina triloba]